MSELTPELKAHIDARSYESLLMWWRVTPIGGDPMFQGESGEYYKKVMIEKRRSTPDGGVRASKDVGW